MPLPGKRSTHAPTLRGMRKLLAFSGLFCVLAHAEPPDQRALPDGGSLVTSNGGPPGDGGGPWVTVDTGQVNDWTMSIKCRSYLGSPNVHYRLTADGGTATSADNVLDLDRTFDLPVSQGNSEKYRYLSLLGEDGGPPSCNVFKNPR